MRYRRGDWCDRFVSFSEEEHVQMVLDPVVGLYLEQTRELYTDVCWLQDKRTATVVSPDIVQHNLYISINHRMEHILLLMGSIWLQRIRL